MGQREAGVGYEANIVECTLSNVNIHTSVCMDGQELISFTGY